jgi:hypothetical protein
LDTPYKISDVVVVISIDEITTKKFTLTTNEKSLQHFENYGRRLDESGCKVIIKYAEFGFGNNQINDLYNRYFEENPEADCLLSVTELVRYMKDVAQLEKQILEQERTFLYQNEIFRQSNMNQNILERRKKVANKYLKKCIHELPGSEFEGVPVSNSFVYIVKSMWRLYGDALLHQVPLISLRDPELSRFKATLKERMYEDCRIILKPMICDYLQEFEKQTKNLERVIADFNKILTRLIIMPENIRREYSRPKYNYWGGSQVIVSSDSTLKPKNTVDLSGGQRLIVMSSGNGAADFVIVTDHPNPIVWAFYTTWDLLKGRMPLNRFDVPLNRFEFFGNMAQAVLKMQQNPEDELSDLMFIRVCVEANLSLFEEEFAYCKEKLKHLNLQHKEYCNCDSDGHFI